MSGAAREGAVDEDPGAARRRIVEAAHALVSLRGWQAASSATVAQKAGVSKALVHYHFKTKSALLLGVVSLCESQIAERALRAQKRSQADATNAVDTMIAWLHSEATADDLRVVEALGFTRDRDVCARAGEVREMFGTAVTAHTEDVLRVLELSPRVPVALIAELLATTTLGMAAKGQASRPALEALWLCVLTLTEG